MPNHALKNIIDINIMSVNKVILVGNVGKNPELRMVEGKAVAPLSLATSERMPESGVEATEWHNLVLWGENAELADRYITKGTKLYVEGKLRTRVWQDKNTIKHYVTEVIVDNLDILSRPVNQQK